MSPSIEKTAVIGPDSDRQQNPMDLGDQDALERLLRIGPGSFSLSFAVCNSPVLRDRLIEELCRSAPLCEVVRIPRTVRDIYGYVRDIVPHCDGGLFLTGIESSISENSQGDMSSLKSLNASRDLWVDAYKGPVVFWLSESSALAVSVVAPDFWRFRSHRFHFGSQQNYEFLHASDAIESRNFGVLPQSRSQKMSRIADIRRRLQETQSVSSSSLHGHKQDWWDELVDLYLSIGKLEEALKACREKGEWLCQQVSDFSEKERNNAKIAQLKGMIDLSDGFYESARTNAHEALTIQRGIGNKRGEAAALKFLATIDIEEGNVSVAIERLAEACAIFQATGDKRGEADSWHELAILDANQGHLSLAEEKFRLSLTLKEAIDDILGMATTWYGLALVQMKVGNPIAAQRFFQNALTYMHFAEDTEGEATIFYQLGMISLDRNRPSVAAELVALSCLIRRRINSADHSESQTTFNLICQLLGYDESRKTQILGEVARTYEIDQGASLLANTFNDPG